MVDQKTIDFLNMLKRGGEYSYMWTLKRLQDDKSEKYTTWYQDASELDKLPQDRDVYFGVYPTYTAHDMRSDMRSHKEDVATITCLFADFDSKDETKEQVLNRIRALPNLPTTVIDSGGGYHAYWIFESPIKMYLGSPGTEWHHENITRYSEYLKAWAEIVGADPAARDLARVLRMPGTLNHKYDPPVKVKMLYFDPKNVCVSQKILYKVKAHIAAKEQSAELKRQQARQNINYDLPEGGDDAKRRYCLGALQKEADELALTRQGGRHAQGIKSAQAMGDLVATGYISFDEAYQALYSASVSNGWASDEPNDCERTLTQGIEKGSLSARDLSNVRQHTTPIVPQVPPPSYANQLKPKTYTAPKLTSLKAEVRKVNEESQGKRLPESEPIPCMIDQIHEFGGFAKWHERGMFGLIIGGTGAGKTSLAQDIVEKAAHHSMNSLWWSEEWRPRYMGYRSVFRRTNISFERMMEHRVWLWEESVGVAPDKRSTSKLTSAMQRDIASMAKRVENWPGDVYMPTAGNLDIDSMLAFFAKQIDRLRSEGVDIHMGVWDYLQLVVDNSQGGKKNWDYLEGCMRKIKAFASSYNIWAWILSQPRKDDDQKMREGSSLKMSSAQGASGQKANLVITLNPEFNNSDEMTGKAKIVVSKNSMGRPGVTPLFDVNFKRLTWGI